MSIKSSQSLVSEALKEVKTITLSYTFFKSLDDIPEIDLEKDI